MPKSERQAAIPDLLALVGLFDKADAQLRTFSKGMLQRIGLAQTLLNSPDLIFLDEPTSGLDPIGRRLVRDVIHGLRGEGTAVFLNSHLLSEVEKTCDRVAFIRKGTVLETIDLHNYPAEAVRVSLRVGQPDPDLLAELTQFGQEVSLEKSHGRITLCLPHEERIPELVAWLVTQGHTLYELSPQHLSLEERFLQIIGEDDEVKG
jgi:ABC-2 type transport system ATP-binding protein